MNTMHIGMVAALAATIAFLAIACDGGDGVTVEEFVRNVYEIDAAHEIIAEPLRAELGANLDGLAPGQTLPAGTLAIFTKLFDEEADFADKVETLDAPKGREAQRDEVVQALRAEASYGRGILAAFTDATTLGDLDTALASDEAVAIEQRRTDACLSMQKLADDNNIDVDMTC